MENRRARKFTLDEFFDSDNLLVIRCTTKEEAEKLCKAFHNLGKTWADGQSYLDDIHWTDGHEIGYSNKGCYGEAWTYDCPGSLLSARMYNIDAVVFDGEEEYITEEDTEDSKWNWLDFKVTAEDKRVDWFLLNNDLSYRYLGDYLEAFNIIYDGRLESTPEIRFNGTSVYGHEDDYHIWFEFPNDDLFYMYINTILRSYIIKLSGN